MPSFEGIEVSILVNGKVLKEYDDDNDEEHVGGANEITKYVKATSNANFGIRVLVTKDFKLTSDLLGFGLYLDGLYVDDVMIVKEDLYSSYRPYHVFVEGVSMEDTKGNWIVQNFKFSELKRVEHSSIAKPSDSSTDLSLEHGTVVIRMYRAKFCRPSRMEFFRYDTLPQTPIQEAVSEKLLKGKDVTHSVSIGRPKKDKGNIDRLSCKYMDGKNHPLAVVKFKYRSKRVLQNLLGRPSIPGPMPLEDRPVEGLTVAQMREIIPRQQSVRFIKDEAGASPGLRIKRERDEDHDQSMCSGHSKRLLHRFAQGEIIDLTGED